MRLGEYGRIERAISAAGHGTIYERWRYGRRLLCDDQMTTPRGYFRHGVLEKLIRASGGKVTERELQYRLQCGRTYPKQSQIRRASADFGYWWNLIPAGFPPYEGEEDELPYNPLDTEELIKQHETEESRRREDGQYDGGGLIPYDQCEGGALIPRDTFGDTTPLSELVRWAEQERELARRFNARVDRLCHYIDSLVKAVNGDLNATLGEAERRLHGNSND
jgi:hypothetical protein